jgi:hypothetical protein
MTISRYHNIKMDFKDRVFKAVDRLGTRNIPKKDFPFNYSLVEFKINALGLGYPVKEEADSIKVFPSPYSKIFKPTVRLIGPEEDRVDLESFLEINKGE